MKRVTLIHAGNDTERIRTLNSQPEGKSVTPKYAVYSRVFCEQSMTPPNIVFEREEYGNRENEKHVLEETEDSERRKTNGSEDDGAKG